MFTINIFSELKNIKLFLFWKNIFWCIFQEKKFNMKVFIQLKNIKKNLKKFVHVFKIWFDFQFKWNNHLNKIMQKIKNQINILFKITEFIWNFLLIQIWQVYMMIIRSALIYRIIAWHQFHQQFFATLKSIRIEIMTKLIKQQNMCFQLITDIYKIILLIMLKTETYIFFLNFHLNSVVF